MAPVEAPLPLPFSLPFSFCLLRVPSFPTAHLRSKTTYYCNVECQKANWKSHKGVCGIAPPKVYDVKCSGCGGYGEGLVGENGKCAHCTSKPE